MNNGSIMWASSENGIYAILVIIAGVFLAYRCMRWNKAIHMLAASAHVKKMVHHGSYWQQCVKAILMVSALIFLLLALMRPQWNKKETIIAQEGRDLFIALDISRSMLAQDCKPNRLACAQQKIRTLVRNLSSERVGLILFSGSTFVQCPLTSDYAAFFMFLDQIDVETISSGTTALDQAIQQALRAFKASGERKNKLLVVFTDGEDFSSNLKQVKCQAAQENMKIFTVGIGTAQGAPIPLFDAQGKSMGHQRDAKGSVVISRLNEGILASVSADCGGTYISMTANDDDIQKLAALVRRFEKEKLDDKKITYFQEQYPYFVAVSFVCLLVEWLL